MLSPSEYEHLCDQLMTLYDDLDNAIINDMVRRMMRMGRVSEATAWQARQLQQSGLLYDDVIAEISSRTDASEAQVRTLFEDAGVQSIRNDNHSYTAAGLESIIRLSPAALQTLNAGYMKCSGDLKNMTLTTANTAQTAYINACDLAYMEVTSGTMDYGTAIRRAVQSAAGEGSWVLYPTGHRDRLDVAVRRSVLTGVGQTVRRISVINANDMGCDLMEITAHSGARPTHAVWQGKLASLSGKNAGRTIDGAKVYSLRDIGYGEADGFGGVNCRHDWFPFFEGISSRAYSDERLQQLNARNIEYNGKMYTEYEIDQMQRKLERKIREMKRRVSAADTAVREAPDDQTANQMKDLFTSESVKLKKAEQDLKDFLSQTGNLNDSTRTWVNGFGRSTAQKAVYASKKHHKGLTSGNKNGKIKSGNKSETKQKLAALKDKLKNRFIPEKRKAISQEYLDSLPKLSEPETMEQALKATNPTGRNDNCQRCVPAYEMRRRGYNVTASSPPENYLDDEIGLYDYRNVFKNAEWIKCNGSGLEEISDYLKEAGHGARVEISITLPNVSHLFMAENINGRVMFYDPQSNKTNVEFYFESVIVGQTEFTRIDNLEVTSLIKDCLEV